MKRTPLKRKTPLKRTAFQRNFPRIGIPLGVRSRVAERSEGLCEACHAYRAVELHHRLRRSQGGKHTLANLLHVCEFCHWWIHAHPEKSYELGWLLHREKAA